MGACEAHQAGLTHDADIISHSLSASAGPVPDTVLPALHHRPRGQPCYLHCAAEKTKATRPALSWGFGLAVAVDLAAFRLQRKSSSFRYFGLLSSEEEDASVLSHLECFQVHLL